MTSDGRKLLLRHLSEENFERWVEREAARRGVCGFHVRASEGSLKGVHTTRQHGHSDAHGWPDWWFFKPGRPPFAVELKSAEGRVDRDQRRWHDLLRECGVTVYVWRPDQEDEIRRVLDE